MILFDDATMVRNVFAGKALTHINAVKAGTATKLAGNVFAETTRNAVVKGVDKVTAGKNVTAAVRGAA